MNTEVMKRREGLLGVASGYWPLLLAALAGLYLIGMAQGLSLGAILGQAAPGQGLLHELFHDVRHAAGFMCH